MVKTRQGVLIGENNGPHSRLFLLSDEGLKQIGETNGIHTALAYRDGAILVGRDAIYLRR
jgi:hypothetical protein